MMSTEILIEPASYNVPGGKERIAAAMKACDDATAEVANFAEELMRTHGDTFMDSLDTEDEDDLLELIDAIAHRAKAQDELLRAIAGRPAIDDVKGGA